MWHRTQVSCSCEATFSRPTPYMWQVGLLCHWATSSPTVFPTLCSFLPASLRALTLPITYTKCLLQALLWEPLPVASICSSVFSLISVLFSPNESSTNTAHIAMSVFDHSPVNHSNSPLHSYMAYVPVFYNIILHIFPQKYFIFYL